MEHAILKTEEMVVDRAKLWRDRAEECRTLADLSRAKATRDTLRAVARGYEDMADHEEARKPAK